MSEDLFIDKDLQKKFLVWLEYLKNIKKYSNHTISAYSSDLKIFFKFLYLHNNAVIATKDIVKLDITDLRAFLAERANKKIKAESRSREISVIKSFFNFLNLEYQIEVKSLTQITYPKLAKYLPKAIDYKDIKNILSNGFKVNDSWQELRDYLAIILIYSTGLRISELITLTKSQIFKDYIIVKGKGNKERIVPILDEVVPILNRYLKALPYKISAKEPIFKGAKGGDLAPRIIQRRLQKIRQELCLPEYLTPHSLRHSYATDLLTNGANLREIQELLGHESLTTTERYTKITKSHLLKQYQKYHPR